MPCAHHVVPVLVDVIIMPLSCVHENVCIEVTINPSVSSMNVHVQCVHVDGAG